MLSISMHFVSKHYDNYYTRQVHFQWKLIHYISTTSTAEQVFSDLLPQIWQKHWSHWEKCKYHHHHFLLPQCLCQNILLKSKLLSVFVRQDIFELASLSCRSNFYRIFAQSAIQRLLLTSYRYYVFSALSLFVMGCHLSQQLWVFAD